MILKDLAVASLEAIQVNKSTHLKFSYGFEGDMNYRTEEITV